MDTARDWPEPDGVRCTAQPDGEEAIWTLALPPEPGAATAVLCRRDAEGAQEYALPGAEETEAMAARRTEENGAQETRAEGQAAGNTSGAQEEEPSGGAGFSGAPDLYLLPPVLLRAAARS